MKLMSFYFLFLFRMVRSGHLVLGHLILVFHLRNVPSMSIMRVLLKVNVNFITA
jgi:hypothetical protein